ncbi:Lipin/Ned1/Smp2-domain-containing protein [Fimicolochytrium jonesii]|uniref:Lipin/Ned1/Smp2-domain-containing protein n=1 Tax=Fimicolochytrium jonesii TaxID=1396493 RepID=UPI0022FDC30D|nr:Lipin/Ned1/Smp2-domain-containing protein [Fimicolochytrium jonesii]KAI8819952.1 Lipin/Ned1/Smp2-domain-containing protein [Fimicolochytrium jonesii]
MGDGPDFEPYWRQIPCFCSRFFLGSLAIDIFFPISRFQAPMEPFDLNSPGDENDLFSPTRANGYVSAHNSDIEEDEYPEASPTGDALQVPTEHHGKPDTTIGSTISSANRSDRPIDADDVVQRFEQDARLVGMIQSKRDRKPSAVRGSNEAIHDAAANHHLSAPAAPRKRTPSSAGLGEDTHATPSESPTKDGHGPPSAVVSDKPPSELPIDAEDVIKSFAHDANLVGMKQADTDKNPSAQGIVETSLPGMPEPRKTEDDVRPGKGAVVDDGQVKPAVREAEDLSVSSLQPEPIDSPTEKTLITPATPSDQEFSPTGSEKPKLFHSISYPVTSEYQERRRGSHTRSSSVGMRGGGGEDASAPLDSVDESALNSSYILKRANTGPLSDTEVEYADYNASVNAKNGKKGGKGWGWRWSGAQNEGEKKLLKGDGGEPLDADSQPRLTNMSVDEKVNNYLAGLPDENNPRTHSPISTPNPDSPSKDNLDQPNGGDTYTPGEGLSVAFNHDVELEISMVPYDRVISLRPRDADELFNKNVVGYEAFAKTPELFADTSLTLRINGHYFNWAVAGPMIMSNLAFKKPLPEDLVRKLVRAHSRPGLSPDNRRYSFNQFKTWWTRGSKDNNGSDEKDKSKSSPEPKDLNGNSPTPPSPTAQISAEDEGPMKEPNQTPAAPTDKLKEQLEEQRSFPMHFAKSLRLTSEQLKQLNLQPGPNTITFTVSQSAASVSAKLFLYDHNCNIVISDIDGTITKSDALGHIFTMVGKDWTHSGIASLYTNIRKNGYHILYLTSRAIGQAGATREYLSKIEQNGHQLPEGPVIMSPDRLFASFHREVILRKPEEFKMACLRDIKRLFVDRTPFYAGFGNRITDALSYRSVDVPSSRIFTIDSTGEIKLELLANYKSSYIKLNDLVDQIFPPIGQEKVTVSDFNDWNFWKSDLPKIELPDVDDADVDAAGRGRRGGGKKGGKPPNINNNKNGKKQGKNLAKPASDEEYDEDEDEFTDDEEAYEDEDMYDDEDLDEDEFTDDEDDEHFHQHNGTANAHTTSPTHPSAVPIPHGTGLITTRHPVGSPKAEEGEDVDVRFPGGMQRGNTVRMGSLEREKVERVLGRADSAPARVVSPVRK